MGSLSHGKPLAARKEFLLSVFTHWTKCHNLLHLPEFQPWIIDFCLWKWIVPLVCLFPQIPGKLCFTFRFHIALQQCSLAEADGGVSKHYQATCLHQQNPKHKKEMNIHTTTASISIIIQGKWGKGLGELVKRGGVELFGDIFIPCAKYLAEWRSCIFSTLQSHGLTTASC